jgi:hypothetical protein
VSKYFDGTEVLVEDTPTHKRWRRADGKYLLRTASRLHLYPNDSVQTNPDCWGEIEDDGGVKTAKNNPTGKGATLVSETNSVDPSYRTYESFDTSSIGAGATVTAADLTVYISDIGSPALEEGDSIDYQLDFKVGHDFIGAAVSTDDWDGATDSNLQDWSATPPSVPTSFQKSINPAHINVDGDTDFEFIDECNYVGVASGLAVEFEFEAKVVPGGAWRTYLDVVYTPAAAGGSRNQVAIIG